MDWKEAIGAIIAGIVLLLPAVKWLIHDWAKKAEEIELLKNKNTSKALERFEDDVKDFRNTISSVQAEMRSLRESMIQNKAQLIAFDEKLKESRNTIEAHSLNLAGNIRQLIRTELVEISKTATLIRDKKHGQ